MGIFPITSYLKKNILNIVLSIVIVLIFLIIFSYFYVLSRLKSLKTDWQKIRCNPLYMPFSGIIDSKNNKSNIEHSILNYYYCTSGILKNSSKVSLGEIKKTNNEIDKRSENLLKYTSDMNKYTKGMKKNSFKTSSFMRDKVKNLFVVFYKFIEQSKIIMNRAMAVNTASLYAIKGGGLTGLSFVKLIMNIIIIVIYILIAIVVSAMVLGGILLLSGPFGWIAAIVVFILAITGLTILLKFLDIALPAINTGTEIIDSITG